MKTMKFTVPPLIALGLLSTPLYADDAVGSVTDADGAGDATADTRVGEGLNGLGENIGDGGTELGENIGDGETELGENIGDGETELGSNDSLPGLDGLDRSIEASASVSGEVNGEPLGASSSLSADRSGEVSADGATRSLSRDAGGSVTAGDNAASFDSSVDRSAAVTRTEDGLDLERSSSVTREANVNGQTLGGETRQSSVSRSIDTPEFEGNFGDGELAEGEDRQNSEPGDGESASFDDGDSESELGSSG